MKRGLKEEILRIHEITYGKKIITEDSFLSQVDDFVKTIEDDPKKADTLSSDVDEFYNNLIDAINRGGLSQQQRGQYSFQKSVESMQIGLILLGYELPRFGVDGLFGPETMSAVSKFTEDNLGPPNLSESTMISPVGSTVVNSNFGYRILRGKPNNHQGVDLQAETGTEIKAPLDGVVTVTHVDQGICGGTIVIKHDETLTTSYCHCSAINVSVGDNVKKGDVIGLTGGLPGTVGAGNSTNPHLHFGVKKNGVFVDPMKFLGTEVKLGVLGSQEKLGEATTQMLAKLIDLLKLRGVTTDDLKPYIDFYDIEGLGENSFYTKLLDNLGAPSSEENIKFLMAWRQAEGGDAKNNPFNTTYNIEGSTNYNKVGVKNYVTIQDGLIATLKTLKNRRYNCIVNGLINDIGAENISNCVQDLKTWGTGDLVNKVIRGYNSGNQPNVPPIGGS